MTQAEQNIIGEMLLDPNIIPVVSTILEPQMFEDALCGRIFYTIVEASKEGIEPDIAYVATKAADEYIPESIVNDRLVFILENTATSINYQTDAKIIYDGFIARQVSQTLSHLDVNSGNVYDEIAKLTETLNGITDNNGGGRSVSEITAEYKDKYFKKRDKPLIKTGFAFLDKAIGGLEPGDMIIIGARPAVGKSAFALQLASQMSDDGFTVQVFNLEMTDKQIYERFLSNQSGLPQYHIRTAENFRSYEEELIFEGANEKLMSMDKVFISTGSKKVSQIRREVMQKKPDVVVIDYLQLLKTDVSYRGNRYAEVGMISHTIKGLALEMNIPVIVLTQLNRQSEGRESKEPSMGEIRESGDIEQDASVIILLWNKDSDDPSKKGCKIEKNRSGELEKLELKFNGSRMRFEDTEGFMTVDDNDSPFMPEE